VDECKPLDDGAPPLVKRDFRLQPYMPVTPAQEAGAYTRSLLSST